MTDDAPPNVPPDASLNAPEAAGPEGAHRNYYGRTRGHALRARQRGLLDALLPRVALAPGEAPPEGALWLEVGFGSGEHLRHLARAHPEATLLGAEPFVNGMAAMLGHLDQEPLPNVRLHMGDACDLLAALPEGRLGRAYLLYPDPWPKARHHKRRFVSPGPLGLLARALAPGAELRLATDIEDYVRQALEEAPKAGLPLASGPSGTPWEGWPGTRYEQKALREGRQPLYAIFRRG